MRAANENFDLVTTIESSNFSNWDFDYEFPFYTAKECEQHSNSARACDTSLLLIVCLVLKAQCDWLVGV